MDVYKDNFIKIDNDNVINLIVPAMNKYVNSKYHNKAAHINCICYALNTLSREIYNDSELEELSIEYNKQEICDMLGINVIQGSSNRVYRSQYDNAVNQLILNSMYVLQTIQGVLNTYIPIFDRVIYDSNSSVITMEFNRKFIQHIKCCKELKDGYSYLYVDMCVSLSTLNAKIVWAILCKYNAQLKQYGQSNRTNIQYLLKHLSPYKVNGDKVVYTMRNTDLVITVNRALEEINNLLELKASAEGKTTIQGYMVEWEYSENRGMSNNKGKLLAFRFMTIDIPVKKQIQAPPKDTTIKTTFAGVKKEVPDKKEQTTKKPKETNNNMEAIKEIIEYLNLKADTKFKVTSKDTQSHINARIKEGYTVDDFKHVINVKVTQWKNDDNMCKYLRPRTLFGTKMESYVNEKATKPSTDKYSYHVRNDEYEDDFSTFNSVCSMMNTTEF